jgi:hypothetical protein
MTKRITWRQRLYNLTGDRTKEAELLAKQVVDDGVARPQVLGDDTLLVAAKEAVAEAHGDGIGLGNVDPATELASPKDVVDVATSDSAVDGTVADTRGAKLNNKAAEQKTI